MSLRIGSQEHPSLSTFLGIEGCSEQIIGTKGVFQNVEIDENEMG